MKPWKARGDGGAPVILTAAVISVQAMATESNMCASLKRPGGQRGIVKHSGEGSGAETRKVGGKERIIHDHFRLARRK